MPARIGAVAFLREMPATARELEEALVAAAHDQRDLTGRDRGFDHGPHALLEIEIGESLAGRERLSVGSGISLVGKRLGDPSLERVDVQLQAIGISQQALESLDGGFGGRGAVERGASAGRLAKLDVRDVRGQSHRLAQQVRDLARLRSR